MSRRTSIERVLDELRYAAQSEAPVLLLGEPGVGKEHASRHLHAMSPRRKRPFVAVRCFRLTAPALHQALYDSAPSDDEGPRLGALRQAQGGTLLLDGVEFLDEAAQRELLLALLPVRLASPSQRRLTSRLVTNATDELLMQVRRGHFRRDLFHRLAVVRLVLPPLRERQDTIPTLIDEMLSEYANAGGPALTLAPDAQEVLHHYCWPGNVRELKTVLIQAAWRSRGETLRARDIEDLFDTKTQTGFIHVPRCSTLKVAERLVIVETLAAVAGNKKRAAETLGITRRTLYAKLASYAPLD